MDSWLILANYSAGRQRFLRTGDYLCSSGFTYLLCSSELWASLLWSNSLVVGALLRVVTSLVAFETSLLLAGILDMAMVTIDVYFGGDVFLDLHKDRDSP